MRASLTRAANDEDVLKPLLSHKHSIKEASVVGANTEAQIIGYDQGQLGQIFVLFNPFTHGSIFQRTRIWAQIVLYYFVTAVITILFFFLSSEPGSIDTAAATKLSTYFNMFLPFLFGIYLNNIFNRWWTMRADGVGGLNQAINNLSVIMSSQLRQAGATETKRLFLRYGLLSHELVYRAARGTDGDLNDLINAGALKVEEDKMLQDLAGKSSKAQAVWVWIQVLWDKQLELRRIPAHVHWAAMQHISAGRTSVKRIFTILSTQLPFAYVHLMAVLVHLNLLILAFQAGTSIAFSVGKFVEVTKMDKTEVKAMASDSIACTTLVTQLVYLTTVPMVYLGFLELAQEIADPFGHDANDFPRACIHNTIQDESESFFQLGEKMPSALLAVLEDAEKSKPTPSTKHANGEAPFFGGTDGAV